MRAPQGANLHLEGRIHRSDLAQAFRYVHRRNAILAPAAAVGLVAAVLLVAAAAGLVPGTGPLELLATLPPWILTHPLGWALVLLPPLLVGVVLPHNEARRVHAARAGLGDVNLDLTGDGIAGWAGPDGPTLPWTSVRRAVELKDVLLLFPRGGATMTIVPKRTLPDPEVARMRAMLREHVGDVRLRG